MNDIPLGQVPGLADLRHVLRMAQAVGLTTGVAAAAEVAVAVSRAVPRTVGRQVGHGSESTAPKTMAPRRGTSACLTVGHGTIGHVTAVPAGSIATAEF